MNKFFEKVVLGLGSTPAITIYTLWLFRHPFVWTGYTDFISDVAIWIGLLILRGDNIQTERMERQNKAILGKIK